MQSAIDFSQIDQHVGSWVVMVSKDDGQAMIAQLTKVEHFDYGADNKGFYGDLGGTQFEFLLSEDWCTLHVVPTDEVEALIQKCLVE